MSLVLTEEQELLQKSASDFVKRESPVSRARELRDRPGPEGFSREAWATMAELGWPAILIPEAYGGLGMGYGELACVLEECGRTLVPEPLLSTVLLAGNALLLAGTEEQKGELLPGIADGSVVWALAYHERRSRYDTAACETTAEKNGDGYRLSGEKTLVIDGAEADRLVVSARTSGGPRDTEGITLFVVDPAAPGVEIVPQATVHFRNTAVVKLSGVEVSTEAALGAEGEGGHALAETVDRATAGLCAEMLGGMEQAFEITLDYLRTRKQFGVVIGTFQGLKHRAAEIFVEIELARSAVRGACDALDRGAEDAAELISLAKARCSDAAVLVGYEGIQMHGGIGMTEEADIGLYAKRARGSELTFGDAAYHRDRYATLQGF